MAVGVPEHEVFTAADAVLARGERPTVERVRLELGRGSPARVGALLDQWWEQLAGRLRGETRLPGLPTEVAQAFVAVWQQATIMSQGLAEQGLDAQRQELATEREVVAALEARARMDVAQARQQTADAVAARQGAEVRLVDLEQLLTERQTQIDDLRSQRDELQAQRDESCQQLAEVRQHLQKSREDAEQARSEYQRYTRDVEDRAYREIDRAREEGKSLIAQLKDANGQLQATQHTVVAVRKELAETREQHNIAQVQILTYSEQLAQARWAVEQADEQHHSLQDRLQRMEEVLAEAQRSAVAQQVRAETLDVQLAQLRNTLQPKRRQRP